MLLILFYMTYSLVTGKCHVTKSVCQILDNLPYWISTFVSYANYHTFVWFSGFAIKFILFVCYPFDLSDLILSSPGTLVARILEIEAFFDFQASRLFVFK